MSTTVPTGREPPHSHELELSLLGVVLDGRHATAMSILREIIPHPQMFFSRNHRIVYVACLELDDQAERIDAIAVTQLLQRYPLPLMVERLRHFELLASSDSIDGLNRARLRALYKRKPEETTNEYADSALAHIGGFNAVTDLAESFAPVGGLETNAKLVRDLYLKRKLIAVCSTMVDQAMMTPERAGDMIANGIDRMLRVSAIDQSTKVGAIADAVGEAVAQLNEPSVAAEDRLTTGLSEIDRLLISLRPGGLYVLAARPGVGKTSLALTVIRHLTGERATPAPTLLFSLEVDRVDLARKLLASRAGVSFRNLETGNLNARERERVAAAVEPFARWPFFLFDQSDLTIQGLRAAVRRRMVESGGTLKLIVVDYLQLLTSADPSQSEYERVTEISRGLKVLARDLRIPILALSQMSRESEKGKERREPRLPDLRGSGSIEQDADAVIFLHRMNEDAPDATVPVKVIVAKNRFGPTGSQLFSFDADRLMFTPIEEEASDPRAVAAAERGNRGERLRAPPSAGEDFFT